MQHRRYTRFFVAGCDNHYGVFQGSESSLSFFLVYFNVAEFDGAESAKFAIAESAYFKSMCHFVRRCRGSAEVLTESIPFSCLWE